MRIPKLIVLLFALSAPSGCTPGQNADGSESPSPSPSATPTGTPTPDATATPHPTPRLTWIHRIPRTGWSEGLDVDGGLVWHAYPYVIRALDPIDGAIVAEYPPASDYGESVAWFQGKLWTVSNSDANLYAGTLPSPDAEAFDFVVMGTVPEGKSWGITHDGTNLIVTGAGTEQLYFLDPATGALVRTLDTLIDDLEDLAYDRAWIWASSYTEHPGAFFRIDPVSGTLLDVWDLPGPVEECEIVDGLAVADGLLYVTGKGCPWIHVAELDPWP